MPDPCIIIDTVASHMYNCVAKDQLFCNTHIHMAYGINRHSMVMNCAPRLSPRPRRNSIYDGNLHIIL